jgi:putative phosphoribosyl transferase
MSPRFADRAEAARALATRLCSEHLPGPLVVLALPRGGVPIGVEVARRLNAPLDLLLVRKIGAPWQRELAVAAVVDGDHPEVVIDEETSQASGASRAYIDEQAQIEWREIERRRALYLRGRAPAAAPPRSSSMTASPPAPRCVRRSRRCAGAAPRASCWRCRWRRTTP